MKWMIILVAAVLSYTAYCRTDLFSPEAISAPLVHLSWRSPTEESMEALLQPYHYLGKGRQCYAFLSQDGKTVIKFFNHKYLKIPWYGKWVPGEKEKRARRNKYYQQSYEIAMNGDSEILYLHLGNTEKKLPFLSVVDKASRSFAIDLNAVPFVLQRKGEPLYSALESMYESFGSSGLEEGISQFISLIANRIEKKIADTDHDVEHNFGVIDGRVFHLDPGRLFFEEHLWETDLLRQEWWRATHRFRRWLEKKHPESIPFLDLLIENQVAHVPSSL